MFHDYYFTMVPWHIGNPLYGNIEIPCGLATSYSGRLVVKLHRPAIDIGIVLNRDTLVSS